MNIYRFWTMQQQTENARIFDYIDDQLIVVDYDEFYHINKDIYNWPAPSKQHYQHWLKFGCRNSECIIPYRLVQFCKYDNINATECFCLVEWKHKLIGLIQFNWGDKFVYNYSLNSSSSERCCLAKIHSRTLLANAMDITNVDIPNRNGIKYIPLIDRNHILKKDQNVLYQPDSVHKIGFVKHETNEELQGDYKEKGIIKGHAGASAYYCCILCYCTNRHCKLDPTPSNRSAKPRFDSADLEALKYVDRVGNESKKPNYKQSLGNKFGSVCKIYGHNYGASNIHLFGGKCGRYVKDLKSFMLKLDLVSSDLIEQYDEQQSKLFILRSELNLYQRQLKRVNTFNTENASSKNNKKDIIEFKWDDNDNYIDTVTTTKGNKENQINNNNITTINNNNLTKPRPKRGKKKKVKQPRFILHNEKVPKNLNIDDNCNNDINMNSVNVDDNCNNDININCVNIDNESDSDLSDFDTEYLIEKIDKIKVDIDVAEATLLDLTTAMDLDADRLKIWNKYKKDAGFEELDYRDNEITGPNALKFVESWEHLREPLQQISPKVATICKYLFPLLQFVVHISCHKNVLPLDDETIILHKFALIQEEYIGRQLARACRGKPDAKELAVGIKGHALYHEHSRMEWTRMTGAHCADQRPENCCKMCKFHIRENRNQLSKQKVRTLVMKMNCEHALYYDTTNTK